MFDDVKLVRDAPGVKRISRNDGHFRGCSESGQIADSLWRRFVVRGFGGMRGIWGLRGYRPQQGMTGNLKNAFFKTGHFVSKADKKSGDVSKNDTSPLL